MMVKIIGMVMMLIMQPLAATAVSLGRVDVASHLGEAFFAEIPLHLDKDESLSSIFVDLASPIEYRFLEVYRDQSITDLHTAIKQDKRGLRVEIISTKALQSPYINLVLRVRHGRATHFKKFPIFLSLPTVATPNIKQGKPVAAANTTTKPTVQAVKPTSQTSALEKSPFTPFSDWARTHRYGPMVYGDTVFTVARRLRIDKRYTVRQIAMAIFNKNHEKFGKNNINLIKEGSYLDTPTASEVELLSRSEASAAMAAQIKTWRQLTRQPKFARVAEAQKTRYSKRVRIGTQGEGVRHTPAAPSIASHPKPQSVPVQPPPPSAVILEAPAVPAANKPILSTEAQQRIAQLKTDNEILQATVTANHERLAKLEKRLTESTATNSNPKMKLLEARLMRIQHQLEQERTNNKGDLLLWLIYAAAGIIVLLIVVIGVLMRRQPPHPAQQQQKNPSIPASLPQNVEATPVEQTSPSETSTPSSPAAEETVTEGTTAENTEKETADTTSPDPDVDYLTEADVYLRYGMEDEAEAQVKLALQLRPDDPAVHAKLVEVHQACGNTAKSDAAKTAALALLTGGALATFEQLLSPPAQGADVKSDSGEETTSKVTAEDKPEIDDSDLLASISTSTSDEGIDALLDLQDEIPPYKNDDDELQNLLSTVGDNDSENEEEDILDLSMNSADDTDLESLIASLDSAEQQNIADNDDAIDSASEKTPATDTPTAASTDLSENIDATLDVASLDMVEQPDIGEADVTPEDPMLTSSDSLDGELAFDISDLDLSKAKVEKPLVNTTAVESDNDLAFDTSALDLSGIVLPGSSNTAKKETTITPPAPNTAVAQQAEHPDPESSLDIAVDMELDASPSIATIETVPSVADQTDGPPNTQGEIEEPNDEADPSGLDISLDMDDLDALLAHDETANPTTHNPQKAVKQSRAEPQQNQSVDDELGALLDGLDDLDLGGDHK